MKNIHLAAAAALSDRDLLSRLELLADRERHAVVELVAHLAELDTRPILYAADGYGSLFGYCTQALRLSEDAACNRIEAARTCRRFPQILDLLSTGALSLTSVRLLGRHLTTENHGAALARAANKTRRELDALIAELALRADVPSLVRRMPSPKTASVAAPSVALPMVSRPPAARAFVSPSASETAPVRRPSLCRGRSSRRWPRSGTGSSSRSALPRRRNYGACRPCSAARYRTAIRQ